MAIELDIERQNICCEKAFQLFKNNNSVPLPYRKLLRLKLSDAQFVAIGLNNQEIYNDLDEKVDVPLELLNSISFKYRCDELCPFPECFDELHSWERELILNWKTITDLVSWIDNSGLTMERVARWHNIPIEDCRRWNTKRKKIADKETIYLEFQNFLEYI